MRYARLTVSLFLFGACSTSPSPDPGENPAAGSLDLTFNSTGIVTHDLGGITDIAHALAIQGNGKIVAAGQSGADFVLARYDTGGLLDTTFNGNGKVTTSLGSGQEIAYAVAVQTDGKIIAAGQTLGAGTTWDFALARYNTDGSLDTTFNGNGKVVTQVGSNDDIPYELAVQSDGKIVAAGYSDAGSDIDFALVRYNTDGSLDTTFNGTGKVTTAIGGATEIAYAVEIQGDGKIVAVGYSDAGAQYDLALARYNTDGSLDTTFNGTGKVTSAIGSGNEIAYAAALQTDGRIVAAGYTFNGTNADFALVRYNTDGTFDTGFNGTGKVTTPIGNSAEIAQAVKVQTDGKIVAAGYYDNGSNNDFAVVRYDPSGSLDTTFDGTGKVTTAIGNNLDIANALALQADGKIIAAGKSYNGADDDFALARYWP